MKDCVFYHECQMRQLRCPVEVGCGWEMREGGKVDIVRPLVDAEMPDGVMVSIRYLRNHYNPDPTLDVEISWHDLNQNPMEEDPANVVNFDVVLANGALNISTGDGYFTRLTESLAVDVPNRGDE